MTALGHITQVALVMSGDIHSGSKLRPRERSGFQGFRRFSLNSTDSNKPGKLLSLKTQIPRMEQIGFGHSSGTVEKQRRQRDARSGKAKKGGAVAEAEIWAPHDCCLRNGTIQPYQIGVGPLWRSHDAIMSASTGFDLLRTAPAYHC